MSDDAAEKRSSSSISGRSGSSRDSGLLLRGAAFAAGGRAFAVGIRFVTSVLITRSLGAELYGVFAIANRFAGIGSTAARVGQNDAILHFLPKYRSRGDLPRARGILVVSLIFSGAVSTLVAVIIFLAADAIAARYFGGPVVAPVIRVLALGIPFTVIGTVLIAVLRGVKAVRAQEWVRSVVVPVSRLVLCFGVFSVGLGILGLAWAINVSIFLGATAALVLVMKRTMLLSFDGGVTYTTRRVVSFSLPILLLGLVAFGYSNADVFVLGHFETARTVGIYALTLRILDIIQSPVSAFQSMFVPLASEHYGSRQIDRLDDALKSTARWVVMATVPLYLAATLFAAQILSVFGNDFTEGAAILGIVGLVALSNAFAVLAGYAVFMSGRSWLVLGNAALMFVVSVGLYWLLVPELGAFGAALGRAVAFAAFAAVTLVEAHWLIGIHPFHLGLFKPFLAGVPSFALCYWLLRIPASGSLHPAMLGGVLVLFAVSYVALLVMLGMTEEDRELIRKLAAKLRFS